MGVTLSEVKRAARAYRAPLAGESAGYLVLAIADQVLNAPRLVQETDIQLTEDGGLRVLSGCASSDADAELGLRRALDGLLLVASSGSAALTRASRRTSPVGLSALVRELEAALIPVNRAAARRALARIHRETTRALAAGTLPAEDESATKQPIAAALPVDLAPELAEAPHAVPPPPSITVLDIEEQPELETIAIRLAPGLGSALPAQLDAMLSALCDESGEPQTLDESDALTVALDVKVSSGVVSVRDEDFELDVEIVESVAAPTVMQAPVASISEIARSEAGRMLAADDACDQPLTDFPVEACTRPEPVLLRKSFRQNVDLTEVAPEVCEAFPRTPTLGSLAAQLPTLAPEQIAELNAAQAREVLAAEQALTPVRIQDDRNEAMLVEPLAQLVAEAELVLCCAPSEECTKPMPDVAPLSPRVAIVTSRKSDVGELLNSFQVAADDSNQGLCRAIKEMAGLDLTPAPFAALIN
jgi:hypothetical protein